MKKNAIVALLGMALLWISCTTGSKIAGTTDEQLTGSTKAILFNPDGSRARYAKINFFEISDTSNKPELTTTTDTNGSYSPQGLAKGTYNIWSLKDSLIAYQDSVYISDDTNYIKNDTLSKPGSITAIVGVQPNHDPQTVYVQVLGSDKYIDNVDTAGRFTLKGLANGTYTLRLTSTLPDYTPTYVQVMAKSGINETLADTLWLKYTGIPVVLGLKAIYDTLHGAIVISWKRTSYRNFQDYLIYKDSYDSINLSTRPVLASQDTFTIDTIFKKSKISGQFSFSDTNSYRYKYRVCVRTNSNEQGLTYRSVASYAVSPVTVIPAVTALQTTYDTLNGIMHLAWDSIKTIDGFGGYVLVRTIKMDTIYNSTFNQNFFTTIATDTLGYIDSLTYTDSLFKNTLAFSDSLRYAVSYSLCAYRKDWKIFGRTMGSDNIIIEPYFTRVPRLSQIQTDYDTIAGIVTVSWDSLTAFEHLDGFVICRNIQNALSSVNKNDTFMVSGSNSIRDSIYPDIVSFSELSGTTITYSIAAIHDIWGIQGTPETKVITVYSYKKYKPVVYAGTNQNVDIASDVVLQGSVVSSTWPVQSIEWKIGDSAWSVVDSGKTTFKTNSNYNTETIVCIVKATDSMGNIGLDTVNVVKQQLVVTFGNFPSKNIQGTSTISSWSFFANKFWYIGDIDYGKKAVWSTTDFNSWELENASPGIVNVGEIVALGGNLFSFALNSYKSQDGKTWAEITPNLPQNRSNICVKDGALFNVYKYYWNGVDTLCTSSDGIVWNRTGLTIGLTPTYLYGHNHNLFLYSSSRKMVSQDNGLTWADDVMWDQDYATFPDDCYQVVGNDSVIVAWYNERPSGVQKVSMLRNNVWANVPVASLGLNTNNYQNGLFLFNNRLMFISFGYSSSSYTIKSIKLY